MMPDAVEKMRSFWRERRPDKLLFPDRCYLCNELLTDASGNDPCICASCRQDMPYVRSFCMKCGRQTDGKSEYCEGCVDNRYTFDAGRSLLVYTDDVSGMISRYKFRNMRHYSDWFARQLAERLGNEIRAMHADALVPVPLHSSKLASRGFDQTRLIADKLSEQVNVPVMELLIRTRATKPMKELNYESRVMNMVSVMDIAPKYRETFVNHGKIGASEGTIVAEKTQLPHRVMIVDDIFTTGSTVDSCAKVLKRAGVEKVFFITVATGRA